MIKTIRIPKERVSEVKKVEKEVEERTSTNITIEGGEVSVKGDSIKTFDAMRVVKAVARGFKPEHALRLTDKNTRFELINITDFSKGSKKSLYRLRGRVIGTKGKAKRNIEELTNTKVCVFGKTIGVIGKVEDVIDAVQVITSLLRGAKHGTAYDIVERKKTFDKKRIL